MMADSQFQTVEGSSYVRCSDIHCENPLGGMPAVSFKYERPNTFADGRASIDELKALSIPFNPERVIYMRDVQTMGHTGQTVTWGMLYAMLYSAALDEYARSIGDPEMSDKPGIVEPDVPAPAVEPAAAVEIAPAP